MRRSTQVQSNKRCTKKGHTMYVARARRRGGQASDREGLARNTARRKSSPVAGPEPPILLFGTRWEIAAKLGLCSGRSSKAPGKELNPKRKEELNPRDRRGSKPTCKRVVGPEPPIPLLGTLHVVRPGREPKWAQPKSKAKRQGVAGGHSCKWQRHFSEDTQTQCAKREAEEDGEQG